MIGKNGLILGLAIAGFAASASHAGIVKDYHWTGSQAIPDNDPAGTFVEIIVPDSGTIADIDIGILIEHTWQGDLIIELEHVASGTSVPLIFRAGDSDGLGAGFSADNFGNPATLEQFLFDDEAADFYDSPAPDGIGNIADPGIADVTGSWRPYGSQASGLIDTLSAFDGHDKGGEWHLHVSDNALGDTGNILAFSMYIENVPAPGALALFGAFGLMAGRRRRG